MTITGGESVPPRGGYGGLVSIPTASRPGPTLSRSTIDRAAHHRSDPEWLAAAWRRGRVLIISQGKALVTGDPPRLLFVTPDQAPDNERLFLGLDVDQTPYFAVEGELPTIAGARPASLFEVGHLVDDRDAGLLTTAIALINWHARAAYDPVTGAPTVVGNGGWTRQPPDGGPVSWPRTDPAVIMLVHDGVAGPQGRCLLGRQAAWPPGRYSCLAGFVEPGESAEAAVAREVAEEVGIAVRDIRYVASQPWPFPGSLMLGFTAVGDPSSPLVVDGMELAEAGWYSREELSGPNGPRLPPPASIARYIIDGWLSGNAS